MLSEINYKGRRFSVVLAILATLFAYPTIMSLLSTAETLYYPVVSSVNFDKSVTTGNGTIIEGTYKRNRNCRFIAIGWFLRKGELDVAIPIERVLKPIDRPVGHYRFGPWKLFATAGEIEDSGYAVVYHRCHPLYVTESIIYAKGNTR